MLVAGTKSIWCLALLNGGNPFGTSNSYNKETKQLGKFGLSLVSESKASLNRIIIKALFPNKALFKSLSFALKHYYLSTLALPSFSYSSFPFHSFAFCIFLTSLFLFFIFSDHWALFYILFSHGLFSLFFFSLLPESQ